MNKFKNKQELANDVCMLYERAPGFAYFLKAKRLLQ